MNELFMSFLKSFIETKNKRNSYSTSILFNKLSTILQLTDNKVDWAKVKALNPQKYDTPELVEKINQVTDACSKGMCQNKQFSISWTAL